MVEAHGDRRARRRDAGLAVDRKALTADPHGPGAAPSSGPAARSASCPRS
jgi:hypothetical protein